MTALLRAASPALSAALAGGAPLWSADLFAFTLADGATRFNWTSWDSDLVVDGVAYASRAPWLERSSWNVTNTLAVPSLTVSLRALNDGFDGGAGIKTQVHNGLFDGAACRLSRVFMASPGDTAALGAVPLFGGKVAGVDLTGTTATLTIKGKVNDLDQFAPRNLYQIGCNHAFCDAGCTLSRAAFTATFAVGAGPTDSFIPWSSAPAGATSYQNGQVTFATGLASGQTRTIAAATSAGLTLAYPLYQTPAAGDAFSAFQGCDKTFNSGSGQSCTDRGNTQHYKGYEFVPPPNSAY
jgi:uncharacterized phage protein (TIGR02218 family)